MSVKKDPLERIQKLLAHAGLGSRREIETWIREGRILIDGEVAKLGARADINSNILLDGQPVTLIPHSSLPRILIYHKPLGEICSRKDQRDRKTVFEHLPHLSEGRWVMIGRLDFNTSGLLIFTTDGELANRWMHPSSELQREYLVRVFGVVTPDVLHNLTEGVELNDGPAKFNSLSVVKGEHSNQWFRVTLAEGRNRIVRRLWLSQGVKVNRLIRVRFGLISLPENLDPGEYLELNPSQIKNLLSGIEPF